MKRVAVVSDLHCHTDGGARSAESFLRVGLPRTPWRQHPIEALKRRIVELGLSADVLLCPGDFANKCDREGMRAGWDAVLELAEALGADRVIGTLGNHDVDSRRTHGSDPFAPARSLPVRYPTGSADDTATLWRDEFCLVDLQGLQVLVINSVASHTSEDEAKHGLVREATLEAIEEACHARVRDDAIRLALVHHHPHPHEELGLGPQDLMWGGQQLIELLTRFGFHLVVHGHKHHPKLSYAAGDPSAPAVFAAASLTYALFSGLATNTRNLFHLIHLQHSNLAQCTVLGQVRSLEYNWNLGWNFPTQSSASFPATAGFGCRSADAELLAAVEQCVTVERMWAEVLDQHPQVAFILPQTKRRLLASLVRTRGIQVLYGEDGEPELLRRR